MTKQKGQIPDLRTDYYFQKVKECGKNHSWFHWPSMELAFNIVYSYDIFSGYLVQKLKPYGLSRATFNVLGILGRSGKKGCTHVELSRLLLVSRANITEMISSLVGKGLVKRVDSQADKRLCMIHLTKEGKTLLSLVQPFYHKELKSLASALSPGEKEELNRLLTKLRHRVLHLQETNL